MTAKAMLLTGQHTGLTANLCSCRWLHSSILLGMGGLGATKLILLFNTFISWGSLSRQYLRSHSPMPVSLIASLIVSAAIIPPNLYCLKNTGPDESSLTKAPLFGGDIPAHRKILGENNHVVRLFAAKTITALKEQLETLINANSVLERAAEN